MHEMSLAMGMVDLVNARAAAAAAEKVLEVEIAVGKLAGVMESSLSFCFDAAAKGTPAEGAVLRVIDIPAQCRCSSCHYIYEVNSFWEACLRCGASPGELIQGQELRVVSILVDE